MTYLQILVALGALVMEIETMKHARELCDSNKGERAKIYARILKNYPAPMTLFLAICSIGYWIVMAVWILSPVPLVRAAGLTLFSLCGVKWVMNMLKVWYRPVVLRIDSIISIGCLVTGIIMKGIIA